MNGSELRLLLRIMDEAFDHKSWHGTNLYGSVRRLSLDEASWRPQAGRHNVWEIVLHAAYWKYAVRRKLLNEPRGSFPIKGFNWITRPVEGADWRSDVALLASTHRDLRNAIARLSLRQLDSMPQGGKAGTIAFLTGLAAHDLYHAGQIQLLKRLYANRDELT
jgi:uncharacterized damage-inducible protein DinB